MKNNHLILILLYLATNLTGCEVSKKQDYTPVPRWEVGTHIHDSSEHVTTAPDGTIIGPVSVGSIMSMMDNTDKTQVQLALEHAPNGEITTWHNLRTGYVYVIEPTKTYAGTAYLHCRDFVMKFIFAGKEGNSYGSTCKQSNGNWKIVNTP